jgi:NAD(P)-dependent dehydrogenase (short-subunit alcohol dehydrogenase family)
MLRWIKASKGHCDKKVWDAKAQALHVTYQEVMNSVVSQYSLKRIAEPTEVAAAVVFLAADDASGISRSDPGRELRLPYQFLGIPSRPTPMRNRRNYPETE